MSKLFEINPEEVKENLLRLMYIKRWNQKEASKALEVSEVRLGQFILGKWIPKRVYLESLQMRINSLALTK
jgi:hypothetical protein